MKKLLFISFLFLFSISYSQEIQHSQTGNPRALVDPLSTGQVVVEFGENKLHNGDHYTFITHDADADVNDTVGVIFVTPNTTKWIHLIVNISGALQTEVSIFETTTRGTGALQTDYNNNRNVSDTSGAIIYAIANGGANGTLIFQDHFGIDTGAGANTVTGGGTSRGEREWILKQNTSYMIIGVSLTINNVISMSLLWYEHTSDN